MKLWRNKITIIFILIYSLFVMNLFARNGKFGTNNESDTLKSNENLLLNELITTNGISLSDFSPIYYYKYNNVGRKDVTRIIRESRNPDLIRNLDKYKIKQNRFSLIGVTTLFVGGALYFIGSLNQNGTLQGLSVITGGIILISTAAYAWYCQISEFDDIVNHYNSLILQGTSENGNLLDKTIKVGLSYHFK